MNERNTKLFMGLVALTIVLLGCSCAGGHGGGDGMGQGPKVTTDIPPQSPSK